MEHSGLPRPCQSAIGCEKTAVRQVARARRPPVQPDRIDDIGRHVGAGFGGRPSISRRMSANSRRGIATSAIWKATPRLCWTTLAPISISFSRNVSNVWNGSGTDVRASLKMVRHAPQSGLPLRPRSLPLVAMSRRKNVWEKSGIFPRACGTRRPVVQSREPGEAHPSARLGLYVRRWVRWAGAGLGGHDGPVRGRLCATSPSHGSVPAHDQHFATRPGLSGRPQPPNDTYLERGGASLAPDPGPSGRSAGGGRPGGKTANLRSLKTRGLPWVHYCRGKPGHGCIP